MKTLLSPIPSFSRIFAILLLWHALPVAIAATKTWDGSSSGLWATGANWSGSTAPVAGDDLVFPAGAANTTMTNNFSPNRAFNSITFLAPCTVHGNALIVTNGLRCGHTNATVEIRAAVNLGGAQSFTVTNGPAQLLLLNTNLVLGGFTLTVGGNGRVEISSAISGTGGLTKNGTNVLHLYGSLTNGYTGNTTVNAGTLQLNKSGGTSIAGPLFIGDGVGGTDADVVEVLSANQIADSVTITVNASGLLRSGSSVVEDIGPLTLAGGRLNTAGATATLRLLADVTALASSSTARLDGRISFVGSRALAVANGAAHPDLIIGGNLLEAAANSSLTKNGPGTLRVSGYSGLTGNTIIREGVLEAASSDPVGNTIVSNTAVLRAIGSSPYFPIIGFTLTLNGAGDGNGALQLTNGHSGWRGPVVLATHSTIGIFGPTNSFTIGATGATISGAGGFTKIGDGILRITNSLSSTYDGDTFVLAGRLELSNAPGAVAIPDTLWVGDGTGGSDADIVRLLRGDQISDSASVFVRSSGWLDCSPLAPGQNETIGLLTLTNGAHVSGPNGGTLKTIAPLTCTGDDTSSIDGGGYFEVTGTMPVINVTGSGAHPNLDISIPFQVNGLTKNGSGWLRLDAPMVGVSNVTVNAGIFQPLYPNSFGLGTGNTVTVASGATLWLTGQQFHGRSLVLNGQGFNGTHGALRATGAGSNIVWAGSVNLASDSTVWVAGGGLFTPETSLTVTGAVSGVGKFIKEGPGFLRFTGGTANTYSGGTLVRDGYFDLMKTNGVTAIPGHVVIGDGQPLTSPDLHLSAANQIANGFDVSITNGMFDLNTFAETIGTLNGAGAVTLGPGSTLTVSPSSGVTCTFAGGISSPGNLAKGGSGTLLLTGTNTLTGTTSVSAGTLRVNGANPNSPVTISGNGRVDGTGRVATVALSSATCVLTAGNSPGTLTCSNLNASGLGSGIVGFELNGTSPGTGHDQLDVRGTVNLTGLTLAATIGFPSTLSNQFLIIQNDGADAVVGNFNGLPQNSTVILGGETFRVSYTGGTGNDVVLTQLTGVFRPTLTIERLPPSSIRLLWPTNNATGFNLLANTNLTTTNWIAATPPNPVMVGTNWVVTNTVSGQRKFYRLFKP